LYLQRTLSMRGEVVALVDVGVVSDDLKQRASDDLKQRATDVAVLIPPPPGLVTQYLPRLSYVLIEQHQ